VGNIINKNKVIEVIEKTMLTLQYYLHSTSVHSVMHLRPIMLTMQFMLLFVYIQMLVGTTRLR